MSNVAAGSVFVYVGVKVSSKTNKPYICLYVDFGYRQQILSCDRALISELLGRPISWVVHQLDRAASDLSNLPDPVMLCSYDVEELESV